MLKIYELMGNISEEDANADPEKNSKVLTLFQVWKLKLVPKLNLTKFSDPGDGYEQRRRGVPGRVPLLLLQPRDHWQVGHSHHKIYPVIDIPKMYQKCEENNIRDFWRKPNSLLTLCLSRPPAAWLVDFLSLAFIRSACFPRLFDNVFYGLAEFLPQLLL